VSLSRYLAYTRDGVVTATVTAEHKQIEPADWPSGFEQINAKAGTALPGFTYLAIEPGEPLGITVSASPGEIPINGDVNGYNITVVAVVQDCSTTAVADGTTVRLQADKGMFLESGSWWVDRATLGGMVTATLTSQAVAGRVIITATADSRVSTTMAYFHPGEPWSVEVWAAPRQWMYADGRSQLEVWARVYDEYNNDVGEGITVTFVTDYGRFRINDGDTYTTTTETDGLAFATLISDVVPRTALVRAITYNYRQGYTYVFFITPPQYRYIYMPNIARNRIIP
jgi:hypothetical protein